MLYQLKPLFMGERDSLPIDCEMDFSGLEYQNARPFQSPVRVKGEVTASAGVVTLRLGLMPHTLRELRPLPCRLRPSDGGAGGTHPGFFFEQ